jgi:CRISPR-associated protein Cmr6
MRLPNYSTDNPGLSYFKCAFAQNNKEAREEKRRELIQNLTTAAPRKLYEEAYERRKQALACAGVGLWEATLRSPLLTGTGIQHPFEIGMEFSLPYGYPMIKGSSLKGAMRDIAARALSIRDDLILGKYEPKMKKEDLEKFPNSEIILEWAEVFGRPDLVGPFDILDAWMIPEDKEFLMKDVVTPHHQKYYSGDITLPKETDQPIPVSFVSVRPNARFLFGIHADASAVDKLKGILENALQNGVGSKTSSGYGRFGELSLAVPENGDGQR